MRRHRSSESGYSLAEVLVVVTIVGIMSLISVPQFIKYQQAAKLKGGLRVFAADVRNARQVAITRYIQVRIEFTSSTRYSFTYRTSSSSSWEPLPISILTNPNISLSLTPVQAYRDIPAPMTFASNTFGDTDSNSKADILFNSDGTITNPDATLAGGTVSITSPWTDLVHNKMIITIAASGGITSAESHT